MPAENLISYIQFYCPNSISLESDTARPIVARRCNAGNKENTFYGFLRRFTDAETQTCSHRTSTQFTFHLKVPTSYIYIPVAELMFHLCYSHKLYTEVSFRSSLVCILSVIWAEICAPSYFVRICCCYASLCTCLSIVRQCYIYIRTKFYTSHK